MIGSLKESMHYGMKVRDSADPFRDKLFMQIQNIIPQYSALRSESIDFPPFKKGQDIIEYIQSLDSKKLYYKANFLDSYTEDALITLVMITRPKVRILRCFDIPELYKRVRMWVRPDGLLDLLRTEKEFTYCICGVLFPVTLDYVNDTTFNIEGVGEVDRVGLLETVLFLPANFGNVVLSENDVWSHVLTECNNILEPKFLEINMSMRQFISRRIVAKEE
jgi:hypothetical protein